MVRKFGRACAFTDVKQRKPFWFVSTNGIAADHKNGNFDNTVNKTHIEFNVLLTVLRYNFAMR